MIPLPLIKNSPLPPLRSLKAEKQNKEGGIGQVSRMDCGLSGGCQVAVTSGEGGRARQQRNVSVTKAEEGFDNA